MAKKKNRQPENTTLAGAWARRRITFHKATRVDGTLNNKKAEQDKKKCRGKI